MKEQAVGQAATGDRAGLRRKRIVEAARALFVERGFHATGVAQIAARSGVAVGQLYRDFAAKEDIVAQIVAADCAGMPERERLAQAIDRGDAQAVWGWICRLVDPACPSGTGQLFAEIVAEAARNERIAAIVAGARATLAADLEQALALLAPGEHLADRRAPFATILLAQSLGMMQHRLLHPDAAYDRVTDAMMAVIVREIDRWQSDTADRR